MPDPTVDIVVGAASYSLELVSAVRIGNRPVRGQLVAQTGALVRDVIPGAPLHFPDMIFGLGVFSAEPGQESGYVEAQQIDTRWPSMWCLGPNVRTTTEPSTGTRTTPFIVEAGGLVWAGFQASASSAAPCLYWVGSTATWTASGASGLFDTAPSIIGTIFQHQSSTGVYIYIILRQDTVTTGAGPARRVIRVTEAAPATWAVVDSGTNRITTANNTYWGISHTETMYVLDWTSQILRIWKSIDEGANWTAATAGDPGGPMPTGNLRSRAAPRALVKFPTSLGTVNAVIVTEEGIYTWDFVDNDVTARSSFANRHANTGTGAVAWRIPDSRTYALVMPYGRRLLAFTWAGSEQLVPTDLGPPQLPIYRQGNITALAATPKFLWVAIGGEDANHTAGIWVFDGRGWHGPLVVGAAANRQIRALGASTLDDTTYRLHIIWDNATASDTDLVYIQDIEEDPRYVTSYQHTATGRLILPQQHGGLPEYEGAFRNLQVVGTAFTANNNVAAVYAVANSTPIAGDGSWGSTLGAITTSGGSVNYAATPAGTGQAARLHQTRIDLVATGNLSPFITGMNMAVEKRPPLKMVYRFRVRTTSQGTVESPEDKWDDLKAIADATSDLSVIWGGRPATVMAPYFVEGVALRAVDAPKRAGTINDQTDMREAELTLQEV